MNRRHFRLRQFAQCCAVGILQFAFCISSSAERPELPNTPTVPEAVRSCYSRGHAGHYVAWVQYTLTPEKLRGTAPLRRDYFSIDRDQPAEFRWSERDYIASGFDIGHCFEAAAARGEAAEADSFVITQTMPQAPGLNRGQWARLEAHLREICWRDKQTITIDVGPAFLPDHKGVIRIQTIGPQKLWVPTHCWKAALFTRRKAEGRRQKEDYEARAWLIPNRAVDDFQKYSVSIDALEAAIGFDLFPGLDARLEKDGNTNRR